MEQFIFQTEPYEDFYSVKEELGRGNFAFVKRCEHRETGQEYAAKCITKKRSKASKRGMSKDAIASEAGILSALNHEGIIKIYDAFEARQTITLIMELLTGGELFEEISKEEFILEKDACNYTKQILSAIQHMHEMNIVHLDLKPENIVLKHRGSKEIKLIDFGLAKVIEPGKEIREMMGTPEFAAPEVINFDLIGLYTDMWAIGVVTYILLSGASPFLGDDDQETYQNITSCEYDFDEEYFEKITENAKDFIRKLLLKKSKERNTVQDCLNHPWIASEEEETSIIDTKKMRAFVARRRWKQSLKLVATISRLKVLCRNSIPSPTSDMSGDESDVNNEDEKTQTELPVFDDSNDLERKPLGKINKDRSSSSVDDRIIKPLASMNDGSTVVDDVKTTRTVSDTEEILVGESQSTNSNTKKSSSVIHNEVAEAINRKVPIPDPCGIDKVNIQDFELNGISSDLRNELGDGHKDESISSQNMKEDIETHAQYEDLPSPISPIDIKVEDFSSRFGNDYEKDSRAKSSISMKDADRGSQLNEVEDKDQSEDEDELCAEDVDEAASQRVVFEEEEIENENDADTEATLEVASTEISVDAIELDAANDMDNHAIDINNIGSLTGNVSAVSEKEVKFDPEVNNGCSAITADEGDLTAMIVGDKHPGKKRGSSITIALSGIKNNDNEEKPNIAFLERTNVNSGNQQAEEKYFTVRSDAASANIKPKEEGKWVLTSTVAGLTEKASNDGAITFKIGKPTARSGIREFNAVKNSGSEAHSPGKTELWATDCEAKGKAQDLQDGEGSLINAGQMKFSVGMPNSNSGEKSIVKLDDNSNQTCYINEVGIGSDDEDVVVIELGSY